jgi:hypothetical protein
MILRKIYTAKVCPLLALMYLMPTLLFSQVAVTATDHTVQPNQEFTVSVRAANFTNILTCQFSMSWDSTAFEFLGTEGLAPIFLPYPFPHFGFAETDSSKMGFSWADLTLGGVNLDDGAQLFAVKFKVITETSGDYAFSFGDTPTSMEMADVGENVLEVTYEDGNIRVEGTSSVLVPERAEQVRIQCAPNPFRALPQVRAEFAQAAQVRISLYGVTGQQLYEASRFFPSGIHELDFPGGLFKQPGHYWLTIQGEGFSVTHQLIAL